MAKYDEAKAMYNTLCQALDNMRWRYNKEEHEDEFSVFTSSISDDLLIKLAIHIDVDRQVMYLKSPMPFDVPEAMRDTMARAIIRANWYMLNGSFEMDYSDGYVGFKLIIPYMQSMLSTEACKYMIIVSCEMIDKFNDKLKAIAEGRMTLGELQRFINAN